LNNYPILALFDYILCRIYHSTLAPRCKHIYICYFIHISLISKVTNTPDSVEKSHHGGSVPENEHQHRDKAMSSASLIQCNEKNQKLRSTMGDDRLSSLALMHVHPSFDIDIHIEDVIGMFIDNNRKMTPVFVSCNNVAPVTNLCLGRATTRSHSSQWSKKNVAVET